MATKRWRKIEEREKSVVEKGGKWGNFLLFDFCANGGRVKICGSVRFCHVSNTYV